jgi:hypothetical protein
MREWVDWKWKYDGYDQKWPHLTDSHSGETFRIETVSDNGGSLSTLKMWTVNGWMQIYKARCTWDKDSVAECKRYVDFLFPITEESPHGS